jgi:CRISPR-associated protein Csx3
MLFVQGETSMNTFPAIIIGGPPHSGKSVLTYLLTQQLRAWKIDHYVLRACPDGEGDWSQEAPPPTVQLLRHKGQFSAAFVDHICHDLERRHLPLLVDVGGKPTSDQERIFDLCTHAVLIANDTAGLAEWRARAERHGLAIAAELHSTLGGIDAIDATTPVLRGQVADLVRHTATPGVTVTALAERLRDLFSYDAAELSQQHLRRAPTELAVDLAQLAAWLHLPATPNCWQPAHLPAALAYLPVEAISIYGRGPGWLYAALALHSAPHPIYLFDARLGWTAPVKLMRADGARAQHITWRIESGDGYTYIDLKPAEPYLDYAAMNETVLPRLPIDQGVVLGGKIPHWLLVGAALAYRDHPWLAVFQAQFSDVATVVFSRAATYTPGVKISLTQSA